MIEKMLSAGWSIEDTVRAANAYDAEQESYVLRERKVGNASKVPDPQQSLTVENVQLPESLK